MPDYNMEEIIEEWKKEGRPAHSTFHKSKMAEAKERGDKFPAYTTFRDALVKKELIEGKKRSPSESSSIEKSSIDPELLEFLKEYLPDSIKNDLENSFLRWKNKRLEEELEELRKLKKE